jgi:hypothetical protein
MIGYTRDNMGLDGDTDVKIKSLRCARTLRTVWTCIDVITIDLS